MLNNNLLLLKTIIGRRSIYFKNKYITQNTKDIYSLSKWIVSIINSSRSQKIADPKNRKERKKKSPLLQNEKSPIFQDFQEKTEKSIHNTFTPSNWRTPLKIFKKPQQKKKKKKIQDTFLPSKWTTLIIDSSFTVSKKGMKKHKTSSKTKRNTLSPLEERQSRNRFPMMYPGPISPDPKDVPRILKVRGGAAVSSIWPFVSPRKYATMPSLCAARLSSMFAK